MTETWGELIADAGFHMKKARIELIEPFSDVQTARRAALGHNDVLRGLHANLRILDPATHPPYAHVLDGELTRLGHLVAAPAPASRRELDAGTGPWHHAATTLHIAADTLGSHLGPDRAHRTPDAAILDDPSALSAALTTMAALSERIADASCHLALRVHEIALADNATLIDTWARGAINAAVTIKQAAALLATQTTEPHAGRLTNLPAAPLLRPTVADDPIVAARQSFDRIRLIAHRQARGELQAGVETLRALAHVGALASMHAHAIFAAASAKQPADADLLTQVSRSLRGARQAWAGIDTAISGCASITRSPRLLAREAETLNTSLSKLTLTPDAAGWLTPGRMLRDRHHAAQLLALAHHIANRLPDLSRSTSAVARQLQRSGVIVAPTRERDDIDHAYCWAPISPERRDAIRSAITDINRVAHHLIALKMPSTQTASTLSQSPPRSYEAAEGHALVATAPRPSRTAFSIRDTEQRRG